MSITVNLKLGVLENVSIDFTKELMVAGDLIAQEMRGNVKRGLGVNDSALKANNAGYAAAKRKRLGHAKPLIADFKTLVTPANYQIKRIKVNHVRVGYVGMHPKAKMTIGQLAYIHNQGLGNNPKREFAGITRTAVKRVMAYLNDRVARLFK